MPIFATVSFKTNYHEKQESKNLFVGWAQGQPVCLSTPETSLVIDAPQGGELKYVYYGAKLDDADLSQIDAVRTCNHAAYPVYGMNTPAEVALSVRHADGNMSTQMVVESVATTKADNTQEVTVRLKDKVPFYVDVCYRAYQDVDIIETWTEITNEEKKPVVLNQFASAYLPIRRGNVWLSSLYGSWANEGRLVQEPLEPGMKIIKNKDGVRNSHTAHAEVMFSLDGRPQDGLSVRHFAIQEITNFALIPMIAIIINSLQASTKKIPNISWKREKPLPLRYLP